MGFSFYKRLPASRWPPVGPEWKKWAGIEWFLADFASVADASILWETVVGSLRRQKSLHLGRFPRGRLTGGSRAAVGLGEFFVLRKRAGKGIDWSAVSENDLVGLESGMGGMQ